VYGVGKERIELHKLKCLSRWELKEALEGCATKNLEEIGLSD